MSTRTRIAAALVPLVALTACSGGDDSENPEARASSACAAVDGELLAADSQEGEPTLEVPLPDGWETNTSMNSDLIRLAVINPTLTKDDFAPNIIVTAESSPADEQAALDRQLAGLAQVAGTSDITPERGEICGYSAWTFGYDLPATGAIPVRPAEVQVIVVPREDRSITYTMTAQSTASVDPAFDEAVGEIFSGVQITE